jgi:hypothetical protein
MRLYWKWITLSCQMLTLLVLQNEISSEGLYVRLHTGMRQDTTSATWCKERSTVETNEITKTAAHRSESWCWRQFHAADTCSKTRHIPFLCVKTQTSVLKEQHQCTLSTWVTSCHQLDKNVIRRRRVLLRCADSSLDHEWSKTASFVSCLDACLDKVGVWPPYGWQLIWTLYWGKL